MTDQAMSPLRRRMIEDMTIRKFAPKTQHDYVQRVKNFAASSVARPTQQVPRTCALSQLLPASGVGVPTVNPTVSTLRFFFKVTLGRPDLVEHVIRPRAAQAAGGAQSRGGGTAAGCRAGAQIQGGAECGLRRRIARLRGGRAEDLRHRQQTHDHSRRARQRPQRPLRDAISTLLELLRAWYAGRTTAGLAVSGPESCQADDDASAQARLPCRSPDGRDQQARVAPHLAAQLRHPSARAEHRYQGDPGPARNGDILPTNTWLKG